MQVVVSSHLGIEHVPLAYAGAPCVARVDAGGRWLELEPPWASLLGRDSQSLVGKPLEACVHPVDRPAWRSCVARLTSGAEPKVHLRFVRADGTSLPMTGQLTLERAPGSERLAARGTFSVDPLGAADEGQRRRRTELALLADFARQALKAPSRCEVLRRGLEAFGAALGASGGAVVLHDADAALDSRSSRRSPRVAAAFGLSTGFTQALLAASRAAGGEAEASAVARRPGPLSPDAALDRACAVDDIAALGSWPLPGRSGQPWGRVLLCWDVALGLDAGERALAESLAAELALALAAEDARVGVPASPEEVELRALIDGARDAVFVLRGEAIAFANSAALSLLGCASQAEVRERTALEWVHPDHRLVALLRGLRAQRGRKASARHELRLRRRGEGEEIAAEVTELPCTFGGLPAVACWVRDLTEHRRLLARSLQADRLVAIGTLAARVAREVNNPLAYVLANLRYVAEELEPLLLAAARGDRGPTHLLAVAEAEDALAQATEGAERVRGIVGDLGRLSRLDAGPVGSCAVDEVVGHAISVAGSELRHRATVVRGDAGLPRVIGSQARLGQVFVNLLVNAAQAIPEGSPAQQCVRISGRVEGEDVLVQVSDSGCGMSPDLQQRIFEPFFSTRPEGRGAGLGLSICRSLVTEMGGSLSVSSQPGVGSTFTVRLRRAREQVVQLVQVRP
jgi:PAS domain S-box-containing protein